MYIFFIHSKHLFQNNVSSYGQLQKMKAQELLQFLEEGNRLAKPISCSEEVYEVMLSCWKDK